MRRFKNETGIRNTTTERQWLPALIGAAGLIGATLMGSSSQKKTNTANVNMQQQINAQNVAAQQAMNTENIAFQK
jgi:hypothetical protein